jgi:ribosomal protein S18 acetylase RimI-like enzyme
MTRFEWRGQVANAELEALHATAFGHDRSDHDWRTQLERHSLGWACARDGDELLGFVNVAWDGGAHAFLLDTIIAPHASHRGIGTHLVRLAVENAREAGCAWLHVDFEPGLEAFYLDACGFAPTSAGLIALSA